jgi:hypothetical protein
MNTPVDEVLSRVAAIAVDLADGADVDLPLELFRRDAQRRLDQGWTVGEVVRMISYTEEVNPVMSEDEALARMKRLTDAVRARLAKTPVA